MTLAQRVIRRILRPFEQLIMIVVALDARPDVLIADKPTDPYAASALVEAPSIDL
ncbi:hypothetical protein [Bradyrhizobium canariense]|uniref:hypothetical protein n=1 Tax=Bradyrhizobium canariense TaxID=255045 RepID=UPI001CA5A698|nr:hypothetical protein [Bradyrhizobium canariense]